jgi:hypothetical protein
MMKYPAINCSSRPPLVLKSSFVPRHASKSYVKEQFLPTLTTLTDQLFSLPDEHERCVRLQKVFSPPIQFASQTPGLVSLVLGKELRLQERAKSSLSNIEDPIDLDQTLRSTSSLSFASTINSRATSPGSPNRLGFLEATFSRESLASLRSSQSRRHRLPNALQPPRWERGEDAPWNPPTYLQQSRPGSQSHILLESLPIPVRAATRRRWRTSAAPLVATALC